MPEGNRAKILAVVSPAEAKYLQFCWEFWARPKQLLPNGNWRVWLLLAGRGFGKSRTGAETVRRLVETKKATRIALVAPTAGDARDVMVEGESGILAISPNNNRPKYEPSKRRLTWRSGALATLYSADEPERLRGPQHDFAWCDEICTWRYQEAWDMLLFGLRLGADPRAVVTTTPKPIPIVKRLLNSPLTVVTRGTTYENRGNLAPAFFEQIVAQYEGTRMGRQELSAELLDDNPGALWKRSQIDALRVSKHPELKRIVVAVDPAVTSNQDSDETGIVVLGLGDDDHGYVLDDATGILTPDGWAQATSRLYRSWQADRVVAEVNNGGDLVEANLRTVDEHISYSAVRASRGKAIRAEPIAALYEQRKIHHVGMLAKLEDELCGWDPTTSRWSPNRLDALVWGLTELMLEPAPARGVGTLPILPF